VSGAGEENRLVQRWILLRQFRLWVPTEVTNYSLRSETLMLVSLQKWFGAVRTCVMNMEAAHSAETVLLTTLCCIT
jgi:hypothetical protein